MSLHTPPWPHPGGGRNGVCEWVCAMDAERECERTSLELREAVLVRVGGGVPLREGVPVRVACAVRVPDGVLVTVRVDEGRRDPVCVWLIVGVTAGVTEGVGVTAEEGVTAGVGVTAEEGVTAGVGVRAEEGVTAGVGVTAEEGVTAGVGVTAEEGVPLCDDEDVPVALALADPVCEEEAVPVTDELGVPVGVTPNEGVGVLGGGGGALPITIAAASSVSRSLPLAAG